MLVFKNIHVKNKIPNSKQLVIDLVTKTIF